MDDIERLDSQIRTAVSIAVNLLVRAKFDTLASMTRDRWLNADQLRKAVGDYPHRLVPPPESAWNEIDVVQARDLEPATFLIDFPLWTEDEERSDLVLQLRLVEEYPGAFESEIAGIHVL
jgi:hypothetical protein